MKEKLTTEMLSEMMDLDDNNKNKSLIPNNRDDIIKYYYELPTIVKSTVAELLDVKSSKLETLLENNKLPTRKLDDTMTDSNKNNVIARNYIWEHIYWIKKETISSLVISINLTTKAIKLLIKTLDQDALDKNKVPKEVIQSVVKVRKQTEEKDFKSNGDIYLGLSRPTFLAILEAIDKRISEKKNNKDNSFVEENLVEKEKIITNTSKDVVSENIKSLGNILENPVEKEEDIQSIISKENLVEETIIEESSLEESTSDTIDSEILDGMKNSLKQVIDQITLNENPEKYIKLAHSLLDTMIGVVKEC